MDFQDKKIMIVVAHPDDEILGVGASMNRLIDEYNVETKVVILGEGLTSRSESRDLKLWEEDLKIHRDNINIAKQSIGYDLLELYDFPDNRFDTVALLDIIKVVEYEISKFDPDFIFTHHGGDVNIDHQRTFESVVTACRPLPNTKVKTIITFETPSGTEWRASTDPKHFTPNLFMKISKTNLNTKIKAMESYDFEKRDYPHPRSPEALTILAQRWGIVMGVDYCEAFCVVRGLI
jgi:LmbE family N-acetylglucosaminyl deacetylase